MVNIIPVHDLLGENHPALERFRTLEQRLIDEHEKVMQVGERRQKLLMMVAADRMKVATLVDGESKLDKLETAKFATEVGRIVISLDDLLLKVDGIEAQGDERVKAAKKRIIMETHAVLEMAEAALRQAKKLVHFQEYLAKLGTRRSATPSSSAAAASTDVDMPTSTENSDSSAVATEDKEMEDAIMEELNAATAEVQRQEMTPSSSSSPRKRHVDAKEEIINPPPSLRLPPVSSSQQMEDVVGASSPSEPSPSKPLRRKRHESEDEHGSKYETASSSIDDTFSDTLEPPHSPLRTTTTTRRVPREEPDVEIREDKNAAMLLVKEPNARRTVVNIGKHGELELEVPGKIPMSYTMDKTKYVVNSATKMLLEDGTLAVVIPRRREVLRSFRRPSQLTRWPLF